jgi:hypothetical protein
MKLTWHEGLLFATILLEHDGQQLVLPNVLLDTGSVGSIFAADKLMEIGLTYAPDDIVYRVHGIGGTEFVFSKQINRLALGALQVVDFEIEIGAMDYGFALDGIIGLDFLMQVGAILNLATLEITQA